MSEIHKTVLAWVAVVVFVIALVWVADHSKKGGREFNPAANPLVITENIEYDAELVGYYTTWEKSYDSSDFNGEEGPVSFTCDTLVVTGGDDKLIGYFRGLISGHNTVNRLDENNNLLLNLDFSEIADSEKNEILSSSLAHPVSIKVRKKIEPGRSARPCESFFKIISVK